MKNIILFSFFMLVAVFGFTQTLRNDGEHGGEAKYLAQCWYFNGVTLNVHPATLISGRYSFRTIELQNEPLTNSYIKTPWMELKKGNITFKTRLDGAAGGNRRVVVQYIAIDVKDYSEKTPVAFHTFDFPNPVHRNTKIYDVSIPVPTELVNGKLYKILFSFTGTGGSARLGFDNLVMPGVYSSDPSNLCKPLVIEKDTDGDGVSDMEDEFPTDRYRAYSSYLPGKDFGTLMFEDLWPGIGDYDFNDLVLDYRIKKVTDTKNEIVELIIDLRTRAIGAGYKNGFGIEFTGITHAQVLGVTGTIMSDNSIHLIAPNGVEAGNEWATVIPFDNAFKVLPHPGGGVTGVNTEPIGPRQEIFEQTVVVSFKKNDILPAGGSVKSSAISLENFNPFLIRNQDRSIEIHLPGKRPTRHANKALFGTVDDNSSAAQGIYYQSKGTNFPWALHINQRIPYMIEKHNIQKGFLRFEDWVKSNGAAFGDWYVDQPDLRNNKLIY